MIAYRLLLRMCDCISSVRTHSRCLRRHVRTYVQNYVVRSYVWNTVACSPEAWAGICDDPKYIEALETVQEVARCCRDDVLLRVVTARRAQAVKKREAACTDTAAELRRRALEDQAAENARRAELRDLERQAALEDAKAKAAAERRKELEACRLDREEQDAHRKKMARAVEDAKWRQVDFPHGLAQKLLDWRRGLPRQVEQDLRSRVDFLVRFKRCDGKVACPHLVGRGQWHPKWYVRTYVRT